MTRHVSSTKGMKYYNLPMGAPITAGAKEAARLRNGGKSAPKGASKQSRVGTTPAAKSPLGAGPKSMKAPAAPAATATPKVKAVTPPVPKLTLRTTPSIGGSRKFTVGGNEHAAPAGSRVYNSASGADVAYVVTPDGDVHVFGKNGEVTLTPEDQAKVKTEMVASPDKISEVADTPAAPDAATPPDAPATPEAAPVKPAPKATDAAPAPAKAPKKKSKKTSEPTAQADFKKEPAKHETLKSSPSGLMNNTKDEQTKTLHEEIVAAQKNKNAPEYLKGLEAGRDSKDLQRSIESAKWDARLGDVDENFVLGLQTAQKARAYEAANPPKAPETTAPETAAPATTVAKAQDKASKVASTPRNPKSLGENAAPPDAEAIAALSISPYSQAHILPNGEFTPERKKLHDDIIKSFLDGLDAQEKPVQYMNGGGPAAGKGSMTHGTNARLTNYPTARKVNDHTGNFEPFEGTPQALLIDPDAIKQQFPETKMALERIRAGDFEEEDTNWAAHSHEESSLLAKRLHMAAVERRHHIIFDGTGAHIKSVTKTATMAKNAGYKIEANYLYLEPEVGMQRALERAAQSHRVVPPERIRDIYENVPRTLSELHDSGLFDKINVFDNNVARGETAPLIGSGGGTNFTIHDQRAWDSFMSSPDRIHKKAA